jgi:mono/diheme cytochrome c family protein
MLQEGGNTKGFPFMTNWNYYGEKEGWDVGSTLPQSFRGNVATLPIPYARKERGAGASWAGPRQNLLREQNMETTRKKLGTTMLVAALLASACLASTAARADVKAGEATFKAKCAMCHGADGKGKEAMKTGDLGSAEVQKMSDADLSGMITNGKGRMPAYKTLTPDQVKDLVAFIRSLKK